MDPVASFDGEPAFRCAGCKRPFARGLLCLICEGHACRECVRAELHRHGGLKCPSGTPEEEQERIMRLSLSLSMRPQLARASGVRDEEEVA